MEVVGNGHAIAIWGQLKSLVVGTKRRKSRVMVVRATGPRSAATLAGEMTFLNVRGRDAGPGS